MIIWVLIAGEGLALLLALAPGVEGERLVHFGLTSLIVQWISLLTLGCLYLLRRPLAKLPPQYVAYIALALLLLVTACLYAAARWLLEGSARTDESGWNLLFLQFIGIAFTVGLLALFALQNHWRTRQMAVRAKQAELEALQARIRPHFLFNTLNTGAALVHQRPAVAEQLLLDLADLFRAALAGPSELELAEELSLTRRYLEIESLRFGERLQVHWELPSPLPQVMIPTLSIQPLVENAIRHGVEPSTQGGQIQILVHSDNGYACIAIRNPLPPAGTATTQGHNVGLSSVSARVAALTQGRGHLKTEATAQHYTATLALPLKATA